MIRCLHIIGDLDIGGAEKTLCKLVVNSCRQRFEHIVVSLLPAGHFAEVLKNCGCRVVSLNLPRRLPGPKVVIRLAKIIRQLSPDIIQAWMYNSEILSGLAVMLAGNFPVIFNVRHGGFRADGFKTKLIAVCAAVISRLTATRIVSCSETAVLAHKKIGYADRFVVIHNGFLPGSFLAGSGARENLGKRLGLDRDAVVVGMTGRFDASKDHATFIAAAESVVKEFPQTRFVLCGAGVDNGNQELKREIQHRNLQSFFFMLGQRNDIQEVMAGFSVFVSSSANEAFANSIGEAVSLGLPCVVTAAGDSALIVGQNGVVVPVQSPAMLADGILRVLRLSAAERDALGDKMRRSLMLRFSLAKMVECYEKLYTEVVDEFNRGKRNR